MSDTAMRGYAPGNYQCNCIACGKTFIGDKRAVVCKRCAEELDEIANAKDKRIAGSLRLRKAADDFRMIFVVEGDPPSLSLEFEDEMTFTQAWADFTAALKGETRS